MRLEDVHPLHIADTDGVTPLTGDPGVATVELYSSSASFTTAGFFVGAARAFMVQWSTPDAAASGTVKLQFSCDPALRSRETPDGIGVTNWQDYPFVDPSSGSIVTTQAVSGAGAVAFDQPNCQVRWIRAVYTRTSGTARFSAYVQFKGVS